MDSNVLARGCDPVRADGNNHVDFDCRDGNIWARARKAAAVDCGGVSYDDALEERIDRKWLVAVSHIALAREIIGGQVERDTACGSACLPAR